MRNASKRAAARFSTLIVVAVAVGLLQGDVRLYLFLALAGYLLYTLWNLARFEAWIKQGGREVDAPGFTGVWEELEAFIIRLRRRNTARKRRYKSLIKEYRKSSTALPDGAVVLSSANEILWFNKAASRMLALRKASDRGQPIENFLRRPEFVEHLRSEDFEDRLVVPAPHEKGRYYSVEVVPYGQGQRLMLIKDITSEVLSEHMRRDFVANASHELRSPLTVLSGYLESMAEDPAMEATWAGPIGQMRAQTERMTAIVADLLLLSRLESGQVIQDETEVDVGRLLESIRSKALATPGCPATVDLVLDTPARLVGSEADLHSAFGNLVDNAVKYTPPEGAITIRWEATREGGARFSVIDTGMGLEPGEIPRVTERFYRVDKGRTRDAGGTGLGLAIVKYVLQRHDAELNIESVPGRGSTFSCVFPVGRVSVSP